MPHISLPFRKGIPAKRPSEPAGNPAGFEPDLFPAAIARNGCDRLADLALRERPEAGSRPDAVVTDANELAALWNAI